MIRRLSIFAALVACMLAISSGLTTSRADVIVMLAIVATVIQPV